MDRYQSDKTDCLNLLQLYNVPSGKDPILTAYQLLIDLVLQGKEINLPKSIINRYLIHKLEPFPLVNLPMELIHYILQYLDWKELSSMNQVSTLFRNICQDSRLWMYLIKERGGTYRSEASLRELQVCYRDIFVLRNLKERAKKIVDELEQKGIILTQCGNVAGNKSLWKEKGNFNYEDVNQAMKEIPNLYEKSSRYYRCGSYGMKHEMEEWYERCEMENSYLANGDLIIAMILLDFPFGFEKNSINAKFKCKSIKRRLYPLSITKSTEFSKERVKEVVSALRKRGILLVPRSSDNIERAMKEIPTIFEKSTKYCRRDSYFMKIELEQWRTKQGSDDSSIANDDLIIAMILLDFPFSFERIVDGRYGDAAKFKCKVIKQK